MSIVITLNQELNSTWRKKNHSQYHFNTLTLSGGRIRHWMCCWKAVLMIIWTLMLIGIHRKNGPVSRTSRYWMKNLQTETRGPGTGQQEFQQHQDPIIYGQRFGEDCLKQLNAEKNSSGPLNNRSSIMLESWEASISSIWMRLSSRETMKNARKKLKLPMEAATPCKVRKLEHGEAYGENKPNTRKSMHARIVQDNESTRKRLERSLLKIMKLALQERHSIDWVITISCTSLFPCIKQWKYRMRMQQWTKSGRRAPNCQQIKRPK